MTRVLAVTGFAGGFLYLSPKLRDDTLDTIAQQLEYLHAHSPYSYLVLGLVGLLSLMMYVRSCSVPR